MKEKFIHLITSMIPVILGVLIGLLLNDWKDKRNDQRYLKKVMGTIKQEMEENLSDINKILPRQESLIDSLRYYQTNDNISILQVIERNRGLQMPIISNVVWKSFLNAKIELVEYETIATLSSIDEAKEFLEVKEVSMVDFFNAYMNHTGYKEKNTAITHILNIIDSEEQLVEAMEEFISPSDSTTTKIN